jgi:hypothetical protein
LLNYHFILEYWNVGTMEYWAEKGFAADSNMNGSDLLNPLFHLSMFPLFHL